jgi:WD40 repeat protein
MGCADVREKSKRSQDVPVTGLDTLSKRRDAVLVTTRDSRIRLYQGTSSQVVKYKGHKNKVSRIAASFSPDGMYVVCGSDDGCAFPAWGWHLIL